MFVINQKYTLKSGETLLFHYDTVDDKGMWYSVTTTDLDGNEKTINLILTVTEPYYYNDDNLQDAYNLNVTLSPKEYAAYNNHIMFLHDYDMVIKSVRSDQVYHDYLFVGTDGHLVVSFAHSSIGYKIRTYIINESGMYVLFNINACLSYDSPAHLVLEKQFSRAVDMLKDASKPMELTESDVDNRVLMDKVYWLRQKCNRFYRSGDAIRYNDNHLINVSDGLIDEYAALGDRFVRHATKMQELLDMIGNI